VGFEVRRWRRRWWMRRRSKGRRGCWRSRRRWGRSRR
jgi:hypothetical protein